MKIQPSLVSGWVWICREKMKENGSVWRLTQGFLLVLLVPFFFGLPLLVYIGYIKKTLKQSLNDSTTHWDKVPH